LPQHGVSKGHCDPLEQLLAAHAGGEASTSQVSLQQSLLAVQQ
jgi:hypothetical protein